MRDGLRSNCFAGELGSQGGCLCHVAGVIEHGLERLAEGSEGGAEGVDFVEEGEGELEGGNFHAVGGAEVFDAVESVDGGVVGGCGEGGVGGGWGEEPVGVVVEDGGVGEPGELSDEFEG